MSCPHVDGTPCYRAVTEKELEDILKFMSTQKPPEAPKEDAECKGHKLCEIPKGSIVVFHYANLGRAVRARINSMWHLDEYSTGLIEVNFTVYDRKNRRTEEYKGIFPAHEEFIVVNDWA